MTLVVDLLLVIAFLLTLLAGVRNGFFRELFALLGVAGGLYAGVRLTPWILARLPEIFRESDWTAAVLFLVVFAAAAMVGSLIGGLLGSAWEGKKPGGASRLLGLVLGAGRGILLLLFLGAAITLLAPPRSRTLGDSRVLPYLSPGIVWGADVLPPSLREELLRRWGMIPFEREGARQIDGQTAAASDRLARIAGGVGASRESAREAPRPENEETGCPSGS